MAELTTDALKELIQLLEDADVFTAMDPAEVNTPGGWLALDEIRRRNVAGQLQLRCSLYLIAPDVSPLEAVAILADLFTKTTTVLTPDGPVVTQGVVLPDSPTPLPGLRVPINLNGA